MNISETDIVNAALRLIGAETIASIDDPADRSLSARMGRFFFPLVRHAIFESYPWKCVSKPATVTTALETAPTFGYSYAYALPADFVRMVCMDKADRKYKVLDGKTLYCDRSPAYIEYVYLCTDCTKYTGSLVRALYVNLAMELSYAIPQNAELAKILEGHIERVFMPIARYADSAMAGKLEQHSDTLTKAFDLVGSNVADPADFDDQF